MVDAVVREWERQLVERGLELSNVRRLFACFHANDGLLVARDPKHLQMAFDLLTSLFDRVGLETNTLKTEAMVFLPGRIKTCLTEEAYRSRMDPSARETNRGWRVTCQLSKLEVAATYLVTHLEVQHDARHTYVREEICHPAPRSFVARAAPGRGMWHCPVPNCPARLANATNLWWRFAFRHLQDKIRINGRCPPMLQDVWDTDLEDEHLPPHVRQVQEHGGHAQAPISNGGVGSGGAPALPSVPGGPST